MSKSDRLWQRKEKLRKQRDAVKQAKYECLYLPYGRINTVMVEHLDARHLILSRQLQQAEVAYRNSLVRKES